MHSKEGKIYWSLCIVLSILSYKLGVCAQMGWVVSNIAAWSFVCPE